VKWHLSAFALVVASLPAIAAAQPRPKIAIALEARTEGQRDPDAAAARLLEDIRRGVAAIPDVEIVPADGSRRTLWVIAGATAGVTAASLMITERYDRETLMVLGIEDDEMAFKMMALQIVSDHQIFTGASASDVARRIVNALDTGVFARLRKLPPRP
jgi:hypothetical protein